MSEEQKRKLIDALQTRKEQLVGNIELGYKLHSGHHLRDVITILAVLNGDKDADKLLANMPNKGDNQ
jgi:hypothetical protein